MSQRVRKHTKTAERGQNWWRPRTRKLVPASRCSAISKPTRGHLFQMLYAKMRREVTTCHVHARSLGWLQRRESAVRARLKSDLKALLTYAPATGAGAVWVELELDGRLRQLMAFPSRVDTPAESSLRTTD
jgi:hypothetical protein